MRAKLMFKAKHPKGILLIGAVLLLTAAAPADPTLAELTRTESTTALLNHQTLMAKAKMNDALKSALEQPPTWSATVTNVAPLGTILDGSNSVNATVKLLVTRVTLPGSSQNILMMQYKVNEDKFSAFNPALLLENDKIATDKSTSADSLVNNITYPFPAYVELGSTVGGANKVLDEILRKAQLSIPQTYFSQQKVQRVIQDKQTNSYMGVLHDESTRRYLDKDQKWYSGIAVASNEAVMRDLNHMKALQLALQYERFRQKEYQEVLIAANFLPVTTTTDFFNQLALAVGAANANIQTISEKADARAKQEDEEAKKKQAEADKKAGKSSSKDTSADTSVDTPATTTKP